MGYVGRRFEPSRNRFSSEHLAEKTQKCPLNRIQVRFGVKREASRRDLVSAGPYTQAALAA
jgi:hypothetical protein